MAMPVVLASPRDPPVEEAETLPPIAITVLVELWFAGACECPLASQSRPMTIIRTLERSEFETVRQRPLRVNVTPLEPEPLVSLSARNSAAARRSSESGNVDRSDVWVTPLALGAEPTTVAMAVVRSVVPTGEPVDDSVFATEPADGRADERMLDSMVGAAASSAAFLSLRRLITIGAVPSAVPGSGWEPVRSWIGATGVAWSGIGAVVTGGATAESSVVAAAAGASSTTVVVVALSGATSSAGVACASSADAGCAPSVSRQNPMSRPSSATHRRGLARSIVGVSLTLFRTCSCRRCRGAKGEIPSGWMSDV